jgi:galactokinase
MIDRNLLEKKFIEIYGADQPRFFRAPGRVNLIGEHTDYNDGFVLPMAIDKETAIAAVARGDRKIRAYSVNLEESAEFDLDKETPRRQGFWLNYVEGVAKLLEKSGAKLTGADLLIWSDVPTGAGLSSSAALETVVGFALSKLNDQAVNPTVLAKIGQQTEHEYVGAKVGIMDQFVSAHAEAKHALLLDCRSLEYKNVPLETKEVAIVICDTNVKHDLASSEYNTRRHECEQAVEKLKEFFPQIVNLRDVSLIDFDEYGKYLPEIPRRRARHIITENARVLEAAAALKNHDLESFGKLMWKSHESLRDDYEVSCKELDLLVEIAKETEGVLGARMTGGGFGGSTVNLVKRTHLDRFKETIRREYQHQTEIKPTILVSEASGGASEIKL